MRMTKSETINGQPVTEEQVAAWAAEAEAGYDVAALKKRRRGRPGRGAEPSQVVALRLTLDEIAELDARAAREGKARSEVIREALTHSASARSHERTRVDTMDSTTFSRFDAADYLTDLDAAAAYLEATMEENEDDPSAIAAALGAIARSRNLSELARRTGMSREGLYKALSADGNPSFATICKVASALGLKISFHTSA